MAKRKLPLNTEKFGNRIIFHHHDLDGFGGVLLTEWFKQNVDDSYFDEVQVIDYGWEDDRQNLIYASAYREVWIVDLSFNKQATLDLLRSGTQVKLYDHHDSSKALGEITNPLFEFHHSQTRETGSGTSIFYHDFIKKMWSATTPIMDEFVDLVTVYDRFETEDPKWETALNLNRVYYKTKYYGRNNQKVEMQPFVDIVLLKFGRMEHWEWTTREEKMIKDVIDYEQRIYESALENLTVRTDGQGHTFGVVKIGSKISIVARRLLEDRPELEYVIVVNDYKNNVSGKLSCRSGGDFDCTQLEPLNGHKGAAGGMITPEKANALFEDVTLSLPYKSL